MIAEEVAQVLPQVVGIDKDGKVEGVDYSRLTALLIESTKEQQAEIRQLRRQAAAKDAQVRKLSGRVNELEKIDRRTAILEARLARLEDGGASKAVTQACHEAWTKDQRTSATLSRVQF